MQLFGRADKLISAGLIYAAAPVAAALCHILISYLSIYE
jgi:hypothetical protein